MHPLTRETMHYRYLLFDLFHTLVDVPAAPGAEGRYTADILGVGREAWNAACFGPAHPITRPTTHIEVVRALAHSLDPAIGEAAIEAATAERQRRFDYALTHVHPEVLEALATLRQMGCRLALVSNASSGEVSAWPASPLAPLFDSVLFSCDVGLCKPDPAIYRLALTHLGGSAEQALFIGDGGSREHFGAGEVGLLRVLQRSHMAARYNARELRARAGETEAEIDGVAALPALLSRLNAGRG